MAAFSMPIFNSYCIRPPQSYCAEIADFLRNHPSAWTQGAGARDRNGAQCSPLDPSARAWCMLGLIERFAPAELREKVVALLLQVIPPRFTKVFDYNDRSGRSLAEIIACFEKASRVLHAPVVPCWEELAAPHDIDIESLDEELDASMAKLVPWSAINDTVAA